MALGTLVEIGDILLFYLAKGLHQSTGKTDRVYEGPRIKAIYSQPR